jgi:hypothetical protein
LPSENELRVGLVERMVVGGIFVRGGHKLVMFDSEKRERSELEEVRCKEVDDLHVML